MTALEFIKKFGWFTSKEYLAGATVFDNHLMVFTNTDDLKQYVDAYQILEDWFNTNSVGLDLSLKNAKKELNEMKLNGVTKHHHRFADYMVLKICDLKQAITLVEQVNEQK